MRETVDRPAQIIAISRSATIKAAAEKMLGNNVGCLVVTDEDGKFAGIVTERDIVNRVVASSKDREATTVADIMTSHVVSCSPETPTGEAREIMTDNGIRHLPIVDNGVVVGMLSARDLMGRQLLEDRAAAEEVAMLSTCLKSIDLNEVTDIVTREVPKLFGAAKCVLCFHNSGHQTKGPMLISCNECVCPKEHLTRLAEKHRLLDSEEFYYDSIPEVCEKLAGQSPRLVIPLKVSAENGTSANGVGQLTGYLCMCGLAGAAAANKELVSYKAKLAREILNSHLTNATLYQQARLTSLTDALTGVGSRKLLEDKLQAEYARAKRYRRPFSVAIIDLDNFKMINDVLGHATGDEALVKLAACMKTEKRTPDVLARYGGDEFVILMPETKAEAAAKLMKRLRARTQEIKLEEDLSITVSCGIAQSMPDSTGSSAEIMRRADLALYEAKSAGRDCVKIWDKTMSKRVSAGDLDIEKIKRLQRRIAGLSEQAEQMFIQSIWGLVQALEAKDAYAKRHSENVTLYAVGIAEAMGTAPKQVEVIRRAAMIHDIGKIGVPDTILSKPGRLTPRERSIIEQHPLIAVRILEKMTFLEREIVLVRHHHEKWNGQGYPDGLSGDSIPPGARILAVADTFDALTSNRSYHNSRSVAEAMKILTDSSGYELNPEAVKGMVSWAEQAGSQLGKTLDQITPRDLLDLQQADQSCIDTLVTDVVVGSSAT
ncbi:MAG: diguanylate cyclase [Planctomycetes bacterium]|nr:diguanylate cyclase [Planctomycetota bacterium]